MRWWLEDVVDLLRLVGLAAKKEPEYKEADLADLEEEYGAELDELEARTDRKYGDGNPADEPGD